MRTTNAITNLMVFLLIISCSPQKPLNDPIKKDITVFRIDSIKSVYVYYAKSKDDNLQDFRILSKKGDYLCKEKITIDKEYRKVSLIDLILHNSSLNRQKGIVFNNTIIYLKDSLATKSVFVSKNFEGKCYNK